MGYYGPSGDNLRTFSLLKQIAQIPQNLLLARVKWPPIIYPFQMNQINNRTYIYIVIWIRARALVLAYCTFVAFTQTYWPFRKWTVTCFNSNLLGCGGNEEYWCRAQYWNYTCIRNTQTSQSCGVRRHTKFILIKIVVFLFYAMKANYSCKTYSHCFTVAHEAWD